jgi:hypothetical protein
MQIDITGLGRLVNVVRPATAEWFGWLTPGAGPWALAPGARGPVRPSSPVGVPP